MKQGCCIWTGNHKPQWNEKLEELPQKCDGTAGRNDMQEIAERLELVQKKIFSSPILESKEMIDALLKQMPYLGDGQLFKRMQEVAKEVWAREMVELALSEIRPEVKAGGLKTTALPAFASKGLFSSR